MQGKIAIEEHFAMEETLWIYKVDPGRALETLDEELSNLLDIQDQRLAKMDKLGIEMQVLSLNAPMVQVLTDRKEAAELAIRANDYLTEQVAKRPDRFRGFAALPMQDPDGAAKELTRCVKELGFVGALVNGYTERDVANSAVHYDLKEYWPFWEQVEKLDVPFYLHIRDVSCMELLDGHPWLSNAAWSFGVEASTHALKLMCSGLFDQYPKLKIILGHLGEGLPFSIWRADHRISINPRGITMKKKLIDYFRQNFYVTTSGNFHTPSLIDTISEIGADHVLFATDYPFEAMEEAAEWFDAADINEYDKQKIGRLNSMKLFDLEKALAAKV